MSAESSRMSPPLAKAPEAYAPASRGPLSGHCAVPGGRIWYEQLNASAPGTPILVVHGGPATPHDYLRSLAALVPEHPVIVYDQLGCGRSDQPEDASLWRLERFVAELEALVRHLRLDAFHLLAHSAGTMIACDYALTKPKALRGLVLVSPVLSVRQYQLEMQQLLAKMPAELSRPLMLALNGGPTSSLELLEANLAFAEQWMCRLSPWPDELMDASSHINARVRDALWGKTEFRVTGTLRNYERLEHLPALGTPTLLICGQHDFTTPRLCGRYSHALPDAELVVIDNASHMAHLEQPQRFAHALKPFLRRVDEAARAGPAAGV